MKLVKLYHKSYIHKFYVLNHHIKKDQIEQCYIYPASKGGPSPRIANFLIIYIYTIIHVYLS